MTDVCSICGKSVRFGSGRYVNRVPDCNTVEERKSMGRRYPQGDFICGDCDAKGDL